MNRTPQDEEQLDAAIREAVGAVPELPPSLVAKTGRSARAALRAPGEVTPSLRGMAFFSESLGMSAFVLSAGVFYAVAEAIQLAKIFGG